jgi:hypothetical protein
MPLVPLPSHFLLFPLSNRHFSLSYSFFTPPIASIPTLSFSPFFFIPIPSIRQQPGSFHHLIPSIPHYPFTTSPLLSHSLKPSTTAFPASLYFHFPSAHPYPSPIIPPLCPVPISCLPPVNPSRLPHFLEIKLFYSILFYSLCYAPLLPCSINSSVHK